MNMGYNEINYCLNDVVITALTRPSTSFCNAPHRIRESIANQINFWCAYCTWRHNTITYNIAHERVNVELSEYAAYNPYC